MTDIIMQDTTLHMCSGHTSQLSVGNPGSSMISVANAVAISFVAEIIRVRCFWY